MKAIGTAIFGTNTVGRAAPRVMYRNLRAREFELRESWFRDAIFDEPELVVAPCRAAGRVESEEVWLPWAIEKNFGSGPIDVLLVSSYGRIGLVETKLSYNSQRRREVVAQLLDYALALQDAGREVLPALPDSDDAPDEDDLADAVNAGRFLLVIAGDALDPRALRLSDAVLAKHLTNEWDLAMVDLNLFGPSEGGGPILLVPELIGMVQADVRQVVRVQIEGQSPKARVMVDRVAKEAPGSRPTKLQSTEDFMAFVRAEAPARSDFCRALLELFVQCATQSSGRIRFGLESKTANLYAIDSVGRRARFLTVWPDGELRVIFRYLSARGSQDAAEAMRTAVRRLTVVGPDAKRAAIPASISQERSIALAQEIISIIAAET